MEACWKPLEALLGDRCCVGFMLMGRTSGINQYKHVISRRNLFLDDYGRAYEPVGDGRFREIPVEVAIDRIEAPLKEIGETLETPYDSAYVRRKNAALSDAGFEVLRIQIAMAGHEI